MALGQLAVALVGVVGQAGDEREQRRAGSGAALDRDGMERIGRGVSLARTGLEEARDAVGTLRDAALPGPGQLSALVEDFGRTSGIRCRIEERGDPVVIAPDAQVALYRSAQEALTNVVRHSGATCCQISGALTDRELVIEVVDDGCGMSPEVLAHVGKPFFSGDGNGMGLGFHQCRRIIEGKGGTIAIQSEPGKGTAIQFSLRLSPG